MPIDILFAPISGGNFVSQVTIISTLLEAREGKKFDMMLGASGGNLASYLSLLFDKTSESVEKVLYKLHSDMFIDNWWATQLEFLPTTLIGIFKSGGLYKEGTGADVFVKKIFKNNILIQDKTSEVWSLTYNIKDGMAELFCSKSKSQSIIGKYLDMDMLLESGCQKITYCEGDLDLITKVIIASAAIPPIRCPVKIKGEKHTDGGVARASPGFLFSEAFYEMRNDNSNSLTYGKGGIHYFYILPYDLLNDETRKKDIKKNTDNIHWIPELIETINSAFFSTKFTDKQSIMENWLRITNLSRKSLTHIKNPGPVNSGILKNKLKEIDDKHYFIIFYTDNFYVNIEDFNEESLKKAFSDSKRSIKYEIYHN
jgi:hypothetical protein